MTKRAMSYDETYYGAFEQRHNRHMSPERRSYEPRETSHEPRETSLECDRWTLRRGEQWQEQTGIRHRGASLTMRKVKEERRLRGHLPGHMPGHHRCNGRGHAPGRQPKAQRDTKTETPPRQRRPSQRNQNKKPQTHMKKLDRKLLFKRP